MTLIEAENVTKVYPSPDGNAITALDRVSIGAEKGQIVTLLGPSGCGKSTLLNILGGLDHPTSGGVSVNGRAPRPQKGIGMLFQKPSLLAWRTAVGNVLLPAELLGLPGDAAEERAHELLDMVGLSGWGDHYPWQLSGGMQQRVALARVLLPDPEIILLDEPFGALDEMNRETLDLEMCRIVEATDKTVVMVTHSVYEAVLMSDVIYVLSDHPGRVAGIVDVDIPRPRTIEASGTDRFAETVAQTRALLQRKPAKEVAP